MSSDDGYVAVFVALCLPLLVGMCALAVDVAVWHTEGAKLQKTVDDAALSGVVFLPADTASAFSTAMQTAKANGYVAGDSDGDGKVDTYVTVEQVKDRPTRLRVTISHRVQNSFGSIFGKESTVVTRTSVADFSGPAPMGSPCNVFGNEDMLPESERIGSHNCDSSFGTYWLNISGPQVNVSRGDAFASSWCSRPDDGVSIDGCTSVTQNFATNPNFRPGHGEDGYTYVIRNRASGTIDPQVYDGGWSNQGVDCRVARAAGATVSAAECAGDDRMTGVEGDGSTVRTVFTVHGRSPNPFDPLQGPVLCTKTFRGWNPIDLSDPELAASFNRWVRLCDHPLSVGLNAGDDYVDYAIHIQTYDGSPNPTGGGQNRMALRVSSTGGNEQVSIFAAGRESLYMNTTLGSTKYNLVRLDSSAASHMLRLRFFDFGDVTDSTVDVTINRPDSSTLSTSGGEPFAGCIGQGPDATQNGTLAGCSVTGMYFRKFGGHWETIDIPIPSSYRCNASADGAKCWVTATVTVNKNGGNPSTHDVTTVTAEVVGDPVRLVE